MSRFAAPGLTYAAVVNAGFTLLWAAVIIVGSMLGVWRLALLFLLLPAVFFLLASAIVFVSFA